jgi:hypothetical protein
MRILISISLLFLCACNSNLPDKKNLIDQYYHEHFLSLKIEREEICNAAVLEQVKFEIDSLIDQWVNAELLDSVNFPAKPVRPPKPEHIINKVSKFELDTAQINN